jgi:plasmid stability protein
MSEKPQNPDTRHLLDSEAEFRALLRKVLKSSNKSPAQIADALSIRSGEKISTFRLDNWTSKARGQARRFPAVLVNPLYEVTGDPRLQLYMMGARFRRLVEFAERELAAAKDEHDRQQMRARLLREENGGAGKS